MDTSRDQQSRPGTRRIWPPVFVAVALSTCPLAGTAAEWALAPDARLTETYNDNILLATGPHESVFGTSLNLRATVAVRSPRGALELTPLLRFSRYSDSGLNSNDQFLDLAARYATERANFRLNAGFAHDTTLTSELETTGRVFAGIRRRAVNVTPSVDYAVSERNTVELEYTYKNVFYDAPPATAGLFDYDYHVVQATGSRELSERGEVFTTLFASRFDVPDRSNTTSTYGLQAGYAHAFSATLKGSLSAGVARTNQQIRSLGTPLDVSSTEPVWNARLSKQFERTILGAGVQRSLFPTGEGFLARRDQVELTVQQRFSSLFRGHIRIFAFQNRTLQGRVTSLDRDSFQVSLGVSRQLSERWFLTGDYRFIRSKQKTASAAASSNAVFVSLRYIGRERTSSR